MGMGRTRREYQGNRELAEGINDSEIDQNINAINEQTKTIETEQ
jgi:hypothetical protein